MRTHQLIIALFQRFCWLDEGLQARLHARGWPDVNRPQSMVMTNIVSGIVRPSDIARNLGVPRQAIHSTINQMVRLGIVRLDVDPDDRRHMIVSFTETGARMCKDAQRAMDALAAQITARIGQDRFDALFDALEADWGDNMAGAPAPRRAAC
ncbi:MarR family winged helix-turn-helix transcriptional regulator [Sphingopyxis alaskensis]|jgi:DNA-binding MarR family transcriptional regulator|uniref:Transcriptional regulator, MarR family n=1 Tax=Sphingopyxis alaskensis (strain DSM 13593 / LMG 18877 / RB2256) TaxID=317655 RepID=Q1GS91_SPHAL|nr:MarR family winged helix-turn-helix transcriptional regulator [Sphingopyxis alaskensis]ABF53481.1 transcriptional regulator, MarR family [Sphingopyxis alaskensis RB2256]MCM3421325.1 MarR family winged helix-turn-helix transcriptional regulator [Sphingopyxis alaskensis]